jgi:hypothetical protein
VRDKFFPTKLSPSVFAEFNQAVLIGNRPELVSVEISSLAEE